MSNERISRAIKDFEKARKENNAAQDTHKKEAENTKRTIDAIFNGSYHKTTAEEDAKIKEAGERERAAKEAANLAQAVYLAAGENVANTAANVFIEAATATPEKFSAPTHYKKFENAFSDLLGEDFYFCQSDYSFYIYFRGGRYGHNSTFVFPKENGCIDASNENHRKPRNESTLAELKKDAKNALKYARKIEEKYKELEALDSEYRASIKSHIRELMPYLQAGAIKDEYRLFN